MRMAINQFETIKIKISRDLHSNSYPLSQFAVVHPLDVKGGLLAEIYINIALTML